MGSIKPKLTINFITSNKHKLAEVKTILGDHVNVQNQPLDLIEIQGTTDEVARDKCRRATLAINGPALVEDASLEFDALNGLPGPYIKWFCWSIGNDGLYKLLDGYEDKSATAVSVFAYSTGPDAEPILFHGRTRGKIVPQRGTNGFAFDPIFEYEGVTYAEMDPEKKNMISERAKGILKLKEWLEQNAQ